MGRQGEAVTVPRALRGARAVYDGSPVGDPGGRPAGRHGRVSRAGLLAWDDGAYGRVPDQATAALSVCHAGDTRCFLASVAGDTPLPSGVSAEARELPRPTGEA